MRVVFLGSPEEVIAPLQALLAAAQQHKSIDVVGVVSQPAKPAGRGGKLLDTPVASFASSQRIPLLLPASARNPRFLEEFASWRPDVAVTAAYGQILSKDFLAIPRRATINIHPSLLPEFRGATPVQSTLLAGHTRTGISVLFTIAALDAGNLIVQRSETINPDETAGELTSRLFALSGPLLLEALAKLEDPNFLGEPQDAGRVSKCSKILKQDGAIQWHLPATSIINQYRAFTPWPGVFSFCQGRRITINKLRCQATSAPGRGEAGSLSFNKADKCLDVQTADDRIIKIEQLTPAGGKKMDAAGFWNGLKIRDNVRFVTTDPMTTGAKT